LKEFREQLDEDNDGEEDAEDEVVEVIDVTPAVDRLPVPASVSTKVGSYAARKKAKAVIANAMDANQFYRVFMLQAKQEREEREMDRKERERKDQLDREAREKREARWERESQRQNQLMLAAILSAFNNNNQGRGLASMPTIQATGTTESEEELSSIKSEDSTPVMQAKLQAGKTLSTKSPAKSTLLVTKSPAKSPKRKTPTKKRTTPNKPLPTRASAAAKKSTGMQTRNK
jgi:hypothetical protein